MQPTLPESNAALRQGRRFSRAVPGCPSVGGQRTAALLRTGAMPKSARSRSATARARPHAVSQAGAIATPAASVAHARASCHRSRPTRRSSGRPSAAAELLRYASVLGGRMKGCSVSGRVAHWGLRARRPRTSVLLSVRWRGASVARYGRDGEAAIAGSHRARCSFPASRTTPRHQHCRRSCPAPRLSLGQRSLRASLGAFERGSA